MNYPKGRLLSPHCAVNRSLPTVRVYPRSSNMTKRSPVVADTAPSADTLTPYDKDHLVTYLRLLDASTQGADWTEAARIVLGMDPQREPQRARAVWESHLERAKWMTTHGYKDLVHSGSSRIGR
jgi:hypothetical protein